MVHFQIFHGQWRSTRFIHEEIRQISCKFLRFFLVRNISIRHEVEYCLFRMESYSIEWEFLVLNHCYNFLPIKVMSCA